MKLDFIKYLLLFVIGLNLTSCKQILIMHLQVKDPKIENSESLQKYIEKKNLNKNEHYTITFDGYLNTIRNVGIPDIQIYDNEGTYIPYTDQEECTGGASAFIESLGSKTNITASFPANDSLNLDRLINELRTLEGGVLNNNDAFNLNTDFVVVIYWAKFAGKLNTRDIKKWKKSIANNPNSTFETILVNCDFQEWWDEEDLEKIGISD